MRRSSSVAGSWRSMWQDRTGLPTELHAAPIARARAAGLGITIHAGEMDGPAQIASALACQPDRIGHGWRIIDDCDVTDGRVTSLGPTATALRDAGLPLEICLTSNACLGTPVAEHPLRLLADAGFRVGLRTTGRSPPHPQGESLNSP